uniref:uncharacterized protein C7orf26 homolog isoform X2 n=2 Tax=Macaca TaxID=9539 RepID=UPI0010A23342|nr:uncharacterized protein C7orf26 homolog isoform X2 [Macaca mulatta]
MVKSTSGGSERNAESAREPGQGQSGPALAVGRALGAGPGAGSTWDRGTPLTARAARGRPPESAPGPRPALGPCGPPSPCPAFGRRSAARRRLPRLLAAPQSDLWAPAGRRQRRWHPEQAGSRQRQAGKRAGAAAQARVAPLCLHGQRLGPGPRAEVRRARRGGRGGRIMSDIRHSLLRRDALSAAKEVLYHLDIYFSSQLQSAPLPIVDKGPVELLEEFVFQVPKERSAQPKRTPVVYCVRLAKALVDDYCCLVPGSIQTLKQIFSASPRFCCQFITSVTALYDLSSDDLIPPMDLLEMIVTWIFEDPRLILITFLNTPIAANLPIGFLELTPLVGLIRWCVKAPLAYKRRKKPPLSNGHVSNKVTKDPGVGMDRDSHLLYSKLHLSVLQVLMTLQLHLTEKNLYGRLGLVLFDHMVPLVEEINRLADELNPLNASQEIELSLDRLAQALQVAMASGALLCTRDDLRTLCSRLPHNNLLQLVISGPVQQSPHAALPPGFYPHIHTPPLGYGAVPAHPAAHPALPTHPGHTFISGVTFPFRPIR